MKYKNFKSAFQNELEIADSDVAAIEITLDETIELNSVSTSSQYDATFIRLLLEILYKNNKDALLHRSYSGRTKKTNRLSLGNDGDPSQIEEFKAVSPVKKQTIFTQFRKRIMNSNIPTQEKFIRLKSQNIARLVAVGIANIRKSCSSRDT